MVRECLKYFPQRLWESEFQYDIFMFFLASQGCFLCVI